MGRSRQGGTGGAASASDGSEARASNVVAYLVQGLAGFHGIVINSDDLPPSDGAENNNTRVEDRRAEWRARTSLYWRTIPDQRLAND